MSEDDGIDVGAWWVSQKAKETYAELRRRWDALLAWGAGGQAPERAPAARRVAGVSAR
ncbi:hypothetical protein WMF18_09670 [Sorangium sp. So ce315]|uniref:hypothetical protein n=1 Tax=Sorangium sp. So ce315 TaxID=3133299 RepID=UPI003F6030BC